MEIHVNNPSAGVGPSNDPEWRSIKFVDPDTGAVFLFTIHKSVYDVMVNDLTRPLDELQTKIDAAIAEREARRNATQ